MESTVYDLFQKMEAGNIILAYRGEINNDLLESVYSMMDKHFEEKKTSGDIRKKFFHILVEALQNVFHHQNIHSDGIDKEPLTGFVIGLSGNSYRIITGNYIFNTSKLNLEKRINEINNLSPAELKTHYQQSLAGNEFSEKGGAGLGIIEMARKSGNKLSYQFIKTDEEFSFFVLEVKLNHPELKN